MIIDCHGHYTTAPAPHQKFRDAQLKHFADPSAPPPKPAQISDDEIRATIEENQLKLIKQRGADMTIFSPRASAMAHHEGDEKVSPGVDARVQRPDPARDAALSRDLHRRLPVAADRPGVPIANSVAELKRCVSELGMVGCNLNPDPSGGHWTSKPLTDQSWYPFYEAMVELDVPAMVHVSGIVQRELPRHRRALHQRRHDRLHAVPRRATCSRISRR